MFTYKRLKSKNNAKDALREVLGMVGSKRDLRIAIYHLGENHIECASDEGGAGVAEKYQLQKSVANAIRDDATNHFAHAALAYDMSRNEVYLLDAVPELAVANCLLLCAMNILLETESATKALCTRNEDMENYVTAAPRPCTKAVRDERTGRFIKLAEAPQCEGVVGRRFRLGNIG